jgi:ABC-type Zn uptake system ZnuABC Zn-binding protein ZnuA
MTKRLGALALVLLAVVGPVIPGVQAARKLRVVATIPDLKSLTEAVGGDLVEVDSLTRGTQNFHEAEVRPSMMLKLRRADAVIENGLDLDAWADVAIEAPTTRTSSGVVGDASKFPAASRSSRCRPRASTAPWATSTRAATRISRSIRAWPRSSRRTS